MIDADVRYLAANGLPFHGTATGTLDQIILIVDFAENQGGTICGYRATGSLNAAGDRIEGQGEGFGPGPNCLKKRFTFYLTGTSRVLCEGSGSLPFPTGERNGYTPGNATAIFPSNFPNPWLPFSLGSFDFAIPAGEWDITLVTGHVTHPDVDQDERMRVPFFAASTALLATVVSDDVPTASPNWTTVRRVVLSQPVTQIKVLNNYDGPAVLFPDKSVSIESISYACPAEVR